MDYFISCKKESLARDAYVGNSNQKIENLRFPSWFDYIVDYWAPHLTFYEKVTTIEVAIDYNRKLSKERGSFGYQDWRYLVHDREYFGPQIFRRCSPADYFLRRQLARKENSKLRRVF